MQRCSEQENGDKEKRWHSKPEQDIKRDGLLSQMHTIGRSSDSSSQDQLSEQHGTVQEGKF